MFQTSWKQRSVGNLTFSGSNLSMVPSVSVPYETEVIIPIWRLSKREFIISAYAEKHQRNSKGEVHVFMTELCATWGWTGNQRLQPVTGSMHLWLNVWAISVCKKITTKLQKLNPSFWVGQNLAKLRRTLSDSAWTKNCGLKPEVDDTQRIYHRLYAW